MTAINGIPDSLSIMKTALRVLIAITTGQRPSPGDLDQLRDVAPDVADLPTDDLARTVVGRMLEARAARRARRYPAATT